MGIGCQAMPAEAVTEVAMSTPPLPSAFMTGNAVPCPTAIFLPSGNQAGAPTLPLTGVRAVPSGRIASVPFGPVPFKLSERSNAMRWASGDHDGSSSQLLVNELFEQPS